METQTTTETESADERMKERRKQVAKTGRCYSKGKA